MERKNPLVGATLNGIEISEDRKALRFLTNAGEVIVQCDADCCSHTWVESVELPALGFPALVTAAYDVDMPDLGVMEGCDVVDYYGFKISTDKGEILIDYRNYSNGYYGGNLSWPGEYHYGGVYGQNNSDFKWKSVTDASRGTP